MNRPQQDVLDEIALPRIDERDLAIDTELEPEALERRLHALGIGAEDVAAVRSLHGAVSQGWSELLAPLLDWLRAQGDGLDDPDLIAQLTRYFLDIPACRLERDDIRPGIALWLRLNFSGLDPAVPVIAFSRFLEVVTMEADRLLAADTQARQRAHGALRKIVLLHLGLVTLTLIHQERARFRYNMLFDESTDLPNRILCANRLRQEIAVSARSGALLGAVRINLQFSSQYLDLPGCPTTEQVVQRTAERFKRVLRSNDVLGRLGRSEFFLISPELKSEGHAILAADKLIRTMDAPLDLGEHLVTVRPVIGIALYPAHGSDAEALMELAETAAQGTLESGSSYSVYSSEHSHAALAQRAMQGELRTALQDNELMLHYQPQLDLGSGDVVGAEALLRWTNTRGQAVPPHLIVAAAEKAGLLSALTAWVVNTAMRHLEGFVRQGINVTVSVNLAAPNLNEPGFPDFIEQSLETWGVPPHLVMLEITEGSMIDNMERTLETLMRLKRSGVQMSIDDFGTGYSSLSYLKKLPVNELKIDQVFVRNMLQSEGDHKIVRSVIDLAHNFELEVVAEGVEDLETLAALKDMNCDRIQGYFVSRPMPMEDFVAWCLAGADEVEDDHSAAAP